MRYLSSALSAGCWLMLVCILATGCSRPPAVEFENLHLIASLRTACSAKNEVWLSGVNKAVSLRHQQGHMSDRERTHFERLIAQARSGDWSGAERLCFQFEKAQLNRRRVEPSAHAEHSHSTSQGVALAEH